MILFDEYAQFDIIYLQMIVDTALQYNSFF